MLNESKVAYRNKLCYFRPTCLDISPLHPPKNIGDANYCLLCFLLIIIFWQGCFVPPHLLRLGATTSSPPLISQPGLSQPGLRPRQPPYINALRVNLVNIDIVDVLRLQAGEAAWVRDSSRRPDRRRLPVPLPQQTALPHAGRLHLPRRQRPLPSCPGIASTINKYQLSRWTRATGCLIFFELYVGFNAQCDKLAKLVGRASIVVVGGPRIRPSG